MYVFLVFFLLHFGLIDKRHQFYEERNADSTFQHYQMALIILGSIFFCLVQVLCLWRFLYVFFNSNSTVIENMINFSSTNQIEQRDQENGLNRKKNKREYVKQTISCRNMPKTQTKEPATQKTSQSNERLFQTYLNVAIYLKKTVKKGFTRLNEKPQCNYSITN